MHRQYPVPTRRGFEVNPNLFATRAQFGELTELEKAYMIVVSNDWTVFLDTDPFLATARLTAVGRRWLVPVIRQDYFVELPAGMLDWVRLYRRAHERALAHFRQYSTPPVTAPNPCRHCIRQTSFETVQERWARGSIVIRNLENQE
jgi:hypothetical protein